MVARRLFLRYFLAVANEFVDSISDISQLEYMQEFASLTSDELTAVKSSMTEGAEYSSPSSYGDCYYGYSVRCVARPLTTSLTDAGGGGSGGQQPL